jgi:hypothetical protein
MFHLEIVVEKKKLERLDPLYKRWPALIERAVTGFFLILEAELEEYTEEDKQFLKEMAQSFIIIAWKAKDAYKVRQGQRVRL